MENRKLPRKEVAILSLIPSINWIALILLGKSLEDRDTIVKGVILGAVTIILSPLALLTWVLGAYWYWTIYQSVAGAYPFDVPIKSLASAVSSKSPFKPAKDPRFPAPGEITAHVGEIVRDKDPRNPMDQFEELVAAWKIQREGQMGMDDFFGDVLMDYALYHDITPREKKEDLPVPGKEDARNLYFEGYEGDPGTLPYDVLLALGGHYSWEYAYEDEQFRQGVKDAFTVADGYLKKTKGYSLFEEFTPEREQREYQFFQDIPGAVETREISLLPYFSYGPLREYVENLVALAEGVFVELRGEEGIPPSMDFVGATAVSEYLKAHYK